ncbi:tRNA glutamyl-Q(34) synthetase GluQRS [Profundibacterium mesophilum]|uniref:Glutamyl-tRNA synthetase n=1 Tax=Profundibacterium mesophilum KAUST100406-0324 TaxID=1037889 RepID=A0A921NQC5_9RHOB|nr:tRNA glutamyl-Q(34) synthetase GluQRS [Profundibacterium mesophilum]KAF0675227.1 glutamyl-tRNA synthetase [Profundibacterium mesophilum KAUST100406-0324]
MAVLRWCRKRVTGAPFTTRFAPSPTGPLHLGHAYAASVAHRKAHESGGQFLLRIEDIDAARSRPEWERAIFDDLEWLGLSWPAPVLRQSQRHDVYRAALRRLWAAGALFACACTRRDIAEAASAPQEGDPPAIGPDGLLYPRTCSDREIASGPDLPEGHALRLRMDAMCDAIGSGVHFIESGPDALGETGRIEVTPHILREEVGEIVLARRDMGTSYHLSVVLDDAAQGISLVTRGRDLFEATRIHVVLQLMLGLPVPRYHHHALIRDETGKRLAKRDDARAISAYRRDGATAQDVWAMIGCQP